MSAVDTISAIAADSGVKSDEEKIPTTTSEAEAATVTTESTSSS